MLPAARKGADNVDRSLEGFAVAMKPLVAAAPSQEALAMKFEDVRARVAFYASTPAYRRAFDIHGLGDLADELAVLSKAKRWEEMPGRISDDLVHQFAVVGTYDEIGVRLADRYRGLATSVEFSIPASTPEEAERLRELVMSLKQV